MRAKRWLAAAALGVFLLGGCARMDAKTAYMKGCDLLEEGQYDEAIEAFQSSIDSGFFLPESYRGMGLAQMSEANYADSSISFEKSLLYLDDQKADFQRDTSLYLARSRELQGRIDKAMEILSELILREPDAETLFLRGKLNLRRGNNKEAKADFDQAVELDPGYDLYINIYQVYEDAERSGDGSEYLEMALTEATKSTEDYYEQGLVNYYLQNYTDAREMLINAMRKDPNDGRVVFLLGQVYLATNDIADARALYREHTENKSTAAGAFNGLALCDIAEGNYENALRNVEAGLSIGDESSQQGLLFNEIVLYEKQADWATAKQKAAAYVASYPGDEAGVREYEFLSTR